MDSFLNGDHIFINYYKDSTLCMYGKLQIVFQLIQMKLSKYGFVYAMQPQTVSFIQEEEFSEKINSKNINMIIYELWSIQDSISSFRIKKNKADITYPCLNKEVYHIQRHIIEFINIYKDYLNDSRTDEI